MQGMEADTNLTETEEGNTEMQGMEADTETEEGNTKVKAFWYDLKKKFGSLPKLVLSIVGDSDTFVPKAWPKSVFQAALIEAAKSSGGDTWIICRGKKIGVSALVREAYITYRASKTKLVSEENYKKECHLKQMKLSVKLIRITIPIPKDDVREKKEKEKDGKSKHEGNATDTKSEGKEEKKENIFKTLKHDKENSYKYKYDGTEESLQSFLMDLQTFILNQEVPFMSTEKLDSKSTEKLDSMSTKKVDSKSNEKLDSMSTEKLDSKSTKKLGSMSTEKLDSKSTERLNSKSTEKLDSKSNEKLDLTLPIPIVNILIEGDLKTLDQILASMKNGIPSVVIKGSGKAADLIVDYLEEPGSLKMLAALLFGIRFESKTYNHLKKILKKIESLKWLVNIFDVDRQNPNTLLQVIGEAVMRGWVYGLSKENEQLGTKPIATLEWKRISNVPLKRLLFNPTNDPPHVLNADITSPISLPLYFFFGYQVCQEKEAIVKCGHILLYEALKVNRFDYVKVLLAHGVHFKMKYLPRLYRETVQCSKERCSTVEEHCRHMMHILWQFDRENAGNLIAKDNGGSNKKDEKNEMKKNKKAEIEAEKVLKTAKELCCTILEYKEKGCRSKCWNSCWNKCLNTCRNKCPCISDTPSDDHKNVNMDLLLWALLSRRTEIAKLYWEQGTDHLVSSLICTALLKKLSSKATAIKEHNLSLELNEHARVFGRRTMALLDKMYEMEESYAIVLMDEVTTVWSITTTPLLFAHDNLMYDTVAHTCAQRNMNKIWYKNGAPCILPFLKCCRESPSACWSSTWSPVMRYIINYFLFFVMLVMYSAFVLTSVGHKNYTRSMARFFEYFTYFWGAGDALEEAHTLFTWIFEDVGGSLVWNSI